MFAKCQSNDCGENQEGRFLNRPAAVWKPPLLVAGNVTTTLCAANLLQLIDHYDRANWNLDEEFARGLGRKTDATV
jgi:hypothetical protein